MGNSRRELWYALLAIAIIIAAYAPISGGLAAAPAPGTPAGILLGAAGLLFILLTESLYSFRKRSRRAARWGRSDAWLRFHIFTGIVGPFMIFLHTAWNFNGLAGVVTLLMTATVASGFVGRYIYTLVPRTTAGTEPTAADLQARLASAEAELQRWLDANEEAARRVLARLLVSPPPATTQWSLLAGHALARWRFRWHWWRETRFATGRPPPELARLIAQSRELRFQASSLMAVRRAFALWHAVHVPLQMTLLAATFIHVGAALYYAVLAR